MLMLLLRLHLLMKMLAAAVLVEDLADLLADSLLVLDAQGMWEGPTGDQLAERHPELDASRGPHLGDNKSRDVDVDSSPSQPHTEDL